MPQLFAGLLVAAGVALAGLALLVSRRPEAVAGRALAGLLLAASWWGLAGAVELSVADPVTRVLWGDLKYVGIVLVPPAWLVFVLLFTGRQAWVRPWTLALLAVEPVVVLLALALPVTHDLVRYLPGSELGEPLPEVSVGPLFWVHAVYAYAMVVVATVSFVRGLMRTSRAYWRLSVAMAVSAVLPWTANLLFNLSVGPFGTVDLTPFLLLVTGGVLVQGLLRGRLLTLARVARDVVVDGLPDGVLVLDAYGMVVDANPAARRLLGAAGRLVGSRRSVLLPEDLRHDLRLPGPDGERVVEVHAQPLLDRTGSTAGEVLLLRDVTARRGAEERVAALLEERTRVAGALQSALLPAALPTVPGLRTGALYRPAGAGREIGGDFYELFRLGDGRWCAVLGDVSGKGAQAAAVTARVRFTLRALAVQAGDPARLLRAVNTALLSDADPVGEGFTTLAVVVLEPDAVGVGAVVLLAGHLQPLLRRADGTVEAVGEPGTALGLLHHPDLTPTSVRLHPGDALCLFTDGLVEARRDGEELGVHRVAQGLGSGPVDDPDAAVLALDDLARRWHGGDLADDLAVLVLVADAHGRTEPDGAPAGSSVRR